MKKILIMTHGELASGFAHTFKMIVGDIADVEALSAYTTLGYDLEKEIKKVMDALSEDDELLVVTDLYGGSVNNEWMMHLSDKRIHLVAGINLAFLVEVCCAGDFTEESINLALENARKNMTYCNETMLTKDIDF